MATVPFDVAPRPRGRPDGTAEPAGGPACCFLAQAPCRAAAAPRQHAGPYGHPGDGPPRPGTGPLPPPARPQGTGAAAVPC